jgi:apolipoprotein D and lipocalin family protein
MKSHVFIDIGNNKYYPVISNFDIDRYIGKWYEIARTPFFYENFCDYGIAEYSKSENNLKIQNLCIYKNETIATTTGIATTDIQENIEKPKDTILGIFSVYFDPIQFEKNNTNIYFDPIQFENNNTEDKEGEYWIHDTDYETYSIVGSPKQDLLWILSRKLVITMEDINFYTEKICSIGYSPDNIFVSIDLVNK